MSRFSPLLIILPFFSFSLLAQDSTDVYEEPILYHEYSECLREIFNAADSIKAESSEATEIHYLKENRLNCEQSSPVSRRISLRYLEWGDTVYDDKGVKEDVDKKELFKEGLMWGRIAVEEDTLNHLNYENLSMGFAAVISVSGLKGKANMADSVRIFAEKAIMLDPRNDRAYHILGRWHYEVSKLSWFTRMLSRVIFGESPKGSFERAINYFEQAIKLDNIAVHRYWLGMAYLESGNKEEALEQFTILQTLPLVQHNDQYFKDEAKKLIDKHG
ncbi:MAG: tetratricopeptide repeat protein [Balneolaceae bacterium]|nr:tetratricopeptide repeat protein [Balneolaceae bacterium]MBO6547576.1 tetratricopeptide repeat protein [Balneolaceae bacterium]MBO6648087.1 tetratricopeptide repeat protein [Balneolaceae bacterium]